MISNLDMSLKITDLKLQPHLPGVNALTYILFIIHQISFE